MSHNTNYRQMDHDDDYDYEESSESDYDDDDENEELQCKNLDPALAKLMGIIIEEQKVTDWNPPLKPGLDNSKEIVSSGYLKTNSILKDLDEFKIIKDQIVNFRKLTDKQLDYIKNLNNEQKFELIQIYNKVIDSTVEIFS